MNNESLIRHISITVCFATGLGNPTTAVIDETLQSGPPNQIAFSGVWILGAPINATNQTVFFTEAGGGISDVLHFTYSQDTNGNGHLDGFVMSDSGTPITLAFLSEIGIVATSTIVENGLFDFSNTNIKAQFQSDVEVTPLPAALPLFATGLGALGLLGWRRKRKAAAIAA
jgi:hypothetical protein